MATALALATLGGEGRDDDGAHQGGTEGGREGSRGGIAADPGGAADGGRVGAGAPGRSGAPRAAMACGLAAALVVAYGG